MKELTIKVHEIAVDGLPPNDDALIGRLAFLFDGCIVSGWPLRREENPELYTPEAIADRAAHGSGGATLTDAQRLAECAATLWEADSDVGNLIPFASVTHWVEFPTYVWNIERNEA
jgi:hypothetical protein